MNSIRLPVIVVLTIVWVLLWGEATPVVLVGGLLVSTLVVALFPFPEVGLRTVFRPWQFVVLVVTFLWDMLIASINVGWLAIRPRPLPPAAVIEVPMITGSDILQVLTAELICLVPGSLLVELDGEGRRMWLHVINVDSPDALAKARAMARDQEYRVLAALGSREEFAAAKARQKEAL